ncbi:recombinase family protein [Streptomyces sp. NBC_01239]|uniref:recombinase family protein n=1 Tax=Streptomyces sp. NBC_01239 TaxID=2903792 RepID=UPI002253E7F2|nr:recombinase family protein [Streptomyces sp. NBC_01239]MCX4813672.1 recombinase family protein [Streptomyces sp. NBC_01239]
MSVKRAIGVVRLSVGNINQTGEETQRRKVENRIKADECDFVDWAVDVDVSASYSPWDRPKLGEWLKDRMDEWDVLYVMKLDRIVRSVRDLSNLLDWCDEHGKSLVSVEEGFDLGTSWGRTIAKILAVLAEAELEVIKERISNSRLAMRIKGRWPGGLVPFGRISVPVEDGEGYTLELCPTYGPWLLKMIDKFLELRSFSGVADWLNANNIPTTQDIARMRAAKAGSTNTRLGKEKAKPRGRKWTTTAVQAVLTSRSLLGEYVRRDGTIERNADGTPVLRSVPVLDPEQFEELQEVVATVKFVKGSYSTSPLLGVLFCHGCGESLYYIKGNGTKRARFRCQGNKAKGIPACVGQSYPAEKILREVEYVFLKSLGVLAIREKVKTSDNKTAVTLAVLEGRMDQLNKEFKAGHLSALEFSDMLKQTAEEHETVTNQPSSKPSWTWRDTGLTFSQWWTSTEGKAQDRREKMIRWQIKIRRGSEGLWYEVGDRVQADITPQGLSRPAKGYVAAQQLDKLKLAA